MLKPLLCIALTVLVCRLTGGSQMDRFKQESVTPEARSLLEVISRLAPVDAVVNASAEGEPPISVCFRDSVSFRPLKIALGNFRGNFRWVPMAQLPYVCIVPLTPDAEVAVSQSRMRAFAVQDIASLARFVERELHLEGVASQGVVVTPIAKHAEETGPGGPALLVADPRQYLSNGFLPTSARDRAVEYWISDEEGDLMYAKTHPPHGTPSEFRDVALLQRVCESKYEDLIILPSEVRSLRKESERMANSWADLKPALDRIARICDMAVDDGLGIVVLGQ